jgi:hypothetical protein
LLRPTETRLGMPFVRDAASVLSDYIPDGCVGAFFLS